MPFRPRQVPLDDGRWLSSIMEPEDENDASAMVPQAPIHPVPSMQGAFEESMMEMTNDPDAQSSKVESEKVDSATRRRILLEQEHNEDTHAARWRQKPGERFHPLWKLVAQISFGVHLLHQQMAKSDEEVVKILQTHVTEVDGFLERTTEDFDLAQNDINERIKYLRLPLEHFEVFDVMLEDRAFRSSIVEGNEKIEHIINRTSSAMNDALKDVQRGLEATQELSKYLAKLDRIWQDRTDELLSVYAAMIGNAQGWTQCFLSLQTKGHSLGHSLVQLYNIVAEMQRRAGIASRKTRFGSEAQDSVHNSTSRGSLSPQSQLPSPRSPQNSNSRDPGLSYAVSQASHGDRIQRPGSRTKIRASGEQSQRPQTHQLRLDTQQPRPGSQQQQPYQVPQYERPDSRQQYPPSSRQQHHPEVGHHERPGSKQQQRPGPAQQYYLEQGHSNLRQQQSLDPKQQQRPDSRQQPRPEFAQQHQQQFSQPRELYPRHTPAEPLPNVARTKPRRASKPLGFFARNFSLRGKPSRARNAYVPPQSLPPIDSSPTKSNNEPRGNSFSFVRRLSLSKKPAMAQVDLHTSPLQPPPTIQAEIQASRSSSSLANTISRRLSFQHENHEINVTAKPKNKSPLRGSDSAYSSGSHDSVINQPGTLDPTPSQAPVSGPGGLAPDPSLSRPLSAFNPSNPDPSPRASQLLQPSRPPLLSKWSSFSKASTDSISPPSSSINKHDSSVSGQTSSFNSKDGRVKKKSSLASFRHMLDLHGGQGRWSK
ncbi:MAG: hypothetical protein M1812_001600 [Candelaria pacifica]|nr:MAG: hypothetical protein M1812_001600 [Candelaria pacifica]